MITYLYFIKINAARPLRRRPKHGMARVGVANYQHSTATPVLQDKYWREGLERAQRDHAFSCFNDPFPKASYAYINTTSNDFLGRTWQVLHHTTSTAAGKCSFHHNVAKPMSTVVKANSSTMSLEAKPVASVQAPTEWSMPMQPGLSGRSRGSSRPRSSTAVAAQSVLQNNMSAPTLRMEDDVRSVRSTASQRSQRSRHSQVQ